MILAFADGVSTIMKPCTRTRAGVLALLAAGFCTLMGCTEGSVNRPSPVVLGVVSIQTNSSGAANVRLAVTNTTERSVLVGVRSLIQERKGVWTTNYSDLPMFIGQAGPGSVASDLMLNARTGTIVTLSPVRASGRFRLEIVCFPQRAGVAGLVDSAEDKFHRWKDGSQHDSYLGASFLVSTPVINALSEPNNERDNGG